MRLFLLMLLATDAVAMSYLPTVKLSWTPPVARTDGTPLALSEIEGYWIYKSGPRWTFTDKTSLYVYDRNCYQLTTLDTDGRESNKSSEVCK